METLRRPARMRARAAAWRRSGHAVGFVPTMGALHAGHLALVAAARRSCRRVVVSVFVNPIQFGPTEDYARYPRVLGKDARLLRAAGADVLFAPSAAAMYPSGFATRVEVGGPVVARLCAPFRPGHFSGVATVVTKLLGVVGPCTLMLGAKDAQQAVVLRRVVADLDFDVRVRVQPTVREADGLARSSRNAYLSPAERAVAPALYRALRTGAAAIRSGERRRARVLAAMRPVLSRARGLRVQYLDIVNSETLVMSPRLSGRVLLAVAAWLGRTRLIDNVTVRVPR